MEGMDRITLYIHLKHSEMVFYGPLLYLEDCKIKLQKNTGYVLNQVKIFYQCMSDKLNKTGKVKKYISDALEREQ